MSKNDYLNRVMQHLNRVMQHLNNAQFYERLPDDPTQQFSEEVTESLAGMLERGVLDRDTFAYLRPITVKTSRFYILPRIHKAGSPGRPIVSSCEAPTENISKFVDYHLGPLVSKIPSYIKDTTDFLLKLREISNLPPEKYFSELDGTSLYTNIPHEEEMEAWRGLLDTREILAPPPPHERCHQPDSLVIIEEQLQVQRRVLSTEAANGNGYWNGSVLRGCVYGQTRERPITTG